MNTHKSILLSGVLFEVKELTGKHQRILTEQKSKPIGENLNEVLADILVSVGSRKNIDLEFVENMLAADRRHALAEARQFTLDYAPEFRFDYDYLKKNERGEEIKEKAEMTAMVSELVKDEETGEEKYVSLFTTKPFLQQCTEYDQIVRDVQITLPRSGKRVIYRLLDGKGEKVGMMTKKDNRSSHTPLEMRFPREIIKSSSNNDVPIKLNLDNLPLLDIEELRTSIKEHEGRVDSEFRFTHPDAENRSLNEKEVVIDILSQLAFFFPSQAI